MRSFSNLWFWIALAVMWSTASHWIIGVPFDMLNRARRRGGEAEKDLEDLVRIYTNRMLFIARVAGIWMLAITCFVLTSLAIGGFYYQVEFAQALFLLGFPMSLVGGLSLNTARIIELKQPKGEALRKQLMRHRVYTQIIGMVAIFFTAAWGMFKNLSLAIPGY